MRILAALLLAALSFTASAEVHIRPINTATVVDFKLYNADGTLDVDEADGGTEVSVSCAGGAETTATNDFVDEGTFYSISLTQAEMNCARVAVVIAATTTEVFFIDTYGASAAIPNIPATLASGSIASGAIDATAIAADAIGASEVADGAIDAATLATDTITAAKIAADAIAASEIAADAIGAAEVANAAIDAATFATAAIDAAAIAADAIGASEVATDAIGAAELAADAIAAAEIANGAIDAATFASGAIDATAIATDAITATEIAADAVGASELAANAITSAEIAADAITAAKFDSTAGQYAPLKIVDQGTAQSATGTTLVLRTAAAFADDELIGAHIVITGGTTGVGQSKAITDYVSSTDTATVSTWTVTPTGTITYKIFAEPAGSGGAVSISAGGITASSFASGAIDATAIAADAIGASELATDAIGAAEVAADAIGAAELATDAIGATELAANAIAAAEVADGAIDEATYSTTAGSFDALGVIDQGTAQAATGTTLQLRSAAAFADDEIIGATCLITGGSAGVGQSRAISDYVSSTDTATVATWTTTPTGTITYECFGTSAGSSGSVSIAAGGITASSFASGAIDATAIAADAIGASELAADAIGASEVATDAIGAAELAASAIGASEIADGGITSTEFGTGAITATTLAADSITSSEVADGAIDAGALATDTITAAKIAADAIGAAEVANATIDAATFASAAIDATAIATDAIGAAELAADAVGASELAADAIGAAEIANAAIDAATFAAAAIDASAIATDAIGAAEVGAGAITNTEFTATGTGLTAIPWNAAWDTEVQSEANDAIVANLLDQLLLSTYNPASPPGAVDSLLEDLVENDAGVTRFTTNSLENGPAGGGGGGSDWSVGELEQIRHRLGIDGTATAPSTGVPSLATAAAVDAVDNFVDTEIGTLLTNVGTPSNLGGGASLAANAADIEAQTDDIGTAGAGLTAVATAIRDLIVEDQGSVSQGCVQAVLLAFAAGDISTSGSTTTWKDPSNGETRIVSVVTSAGNRTATITCPTY